MGVFLGIGAQKLNRPGRLCNKIRILSLARPRVSPAPTNPELARRLRSETTMSLKWIAENLKMGAWMHVSFLLHHKPSTK